MHQLTCCFKSISVLTVSPYSSVFLARKYIGEKLCHTVK